jgi:hypothetical protein
MTTELLEARADRAMRDGGRPLSWWQALGPLLAWAVFFGVMVVGGLLAESTQNGHRPQVADVVPQPSVPADRQASGPDQVSIKASFAP